MLQGQAAGGGRGSRAAAGRRARRAAAPRVRAARAAWTAWRSRRSRRELREDVAAAGRPREDDVVLRRRLGQRRERRLCAPHLQAGPCGDPLDLMRDASPGRRLCRSPRSGRAASASSSSVCSTESSLPVSSRMAIRSAERSKTAPRSAPTADTIRLVCPTACARLRELSRWSVKNPCASRPRRRAAR